MHAKMNYRIKMGVETENYEIVQKDVEIPDCGLHFCRWGKQLSFAHGPWAI